MKKLILKLFSQNLEQQNIYSLILIICKLVKKKKQKQKQKQKLERNWWFYLRIICIENFMLRIEMACEVSGVMMRCDREGCTGFCILD